MFQVKAISAVALALSIAAPTWSATPALAGPEHLQTIHDQCAIQLNGSAPFCNCLMQAAANTLNDNQQALTAAQVTQNTAEFTRVQAMLSVDEAMGVANFMTTFGGCTP